MSDSISVADIMPLIGFYASVRKHSADSFRKRHPEPVLVYTPKAAMTGADKHFVTTQIAAVSEMRRTQGTEAGKKGMEMRVAMVRKSSRNPFAGQIYVGRAANNDIIIEDPGVSKSHAFLEQKHGVWFVTDMGSANGTHIGGQKIESNSALEVRNGSKIALGTLELQFFLPEAFHNFVTTILATSQPTP